MSETHNNSPRVFVVDMAPSPSDSDGSEHDANRSPRPTTPQENENLIEEFHSALGEALLDQLEIHDEDAADSEIEHRTKEEAAARVEMVDDTKTVADEAAPTIDVADMQADDSDPEANLPRGAAGDDVSCHSGTEFPVGSTAESSSEAVGPAMSTRVNALSVTQPAAAAAITNVTTATQESQTSRNRIVDDDNHEEASSRRAIDTISLQQMSPNAKPLESHREIVPDSSSAGDGDQPRPQESIELNSEETVSIASVFDDPHDEEKLGVIKESQTEHEDTVSSPKATATVPEEKVPNYSLWGESSTEQSAFSAEKQHTGDDRCVVSPSRPTDAALPEELQTSVDGDKLEVLVNTSIKEEENEDSMDNDMSMSSPSSRRLPIFATMAAEPSLLPGKKAPESFVDEQLSVEQSNASIGTQDADKTISVSPSPEALPIDDKPGMENVHEDKPLESSKGFDSRLEPVGTPSSDRHVVSSPLATRPSASHFDFPSAALPAAPLFTEDQKPSPPLSSRDSPGARSFSSAAALVPALSAQPEDTMGNRSYVVMANPPPMEHRFVPQNGHPVSYGTYPVPPFTSSLVPSVPSGGRRKIKLRLQEDVRMTGNRRFWFSRKTVSSPRLGAMEPMGGKLSRGTITVSWFEGTTSTELQEHVRRSVVRKMGLQSTSQLTDLRIIDESISPPEEIVLSSYIPDGSEFLLRFGTKDTEEDKPAAAASRHVRRHTSYDAPVSPSAAPSPYPSSADLEGLSASQLKLLGARLGKMPLANDDGNASARRRSKREEPSKILPDSVTVDDAKNDEPNSPLATKPVRERRNSRDAEEVEVSSKASMYSNGEDPVEARLRQITEILLLDRGRAETGRREEKRQVIFVLANYFVLFLSLIAISAEIQARAPRWMAWLETQMESVQQCATDRDALFECVSNGDFSGLIASFILWLTRSAATKRIFLFGFETPKRLWTVVYEALVTAFCWGMSYTFIRRGMNPDTRRNFLQKYWKDAVYGSLAGFNASFMKAVLKNLIPQEAFENALDDRELRLKIFSWLPSFHA